MTPPSFKGSIRTGESLEGEMNITMKAVQEMRAVIEAETETHGVTDPSL